MGNLSFNNGNRTDAEKYYRDALNLTLEVGDKNGTAQDYTYLGNLKFKDGQIDEAEANFDKAIDYFKEADNKASLLQLCLTVARMELTG